jgi:hypothetical protein
VEGQAQLDSARRGDWCGIGAESADPTKILLAASEFSYSLKREGPAPPTLLAMKDRCHAAYGINL